MGGASLYDVRSRFHVPSSHARHPCNSMSGRRVPQRSACGELNVAPDAVVCGIHHIMLFDCVRRLEENEPGNCVGVCVMNSNVNSLPMG